MNKTLLKRFVPHLIAVVAFVLISLVYFFPAFDGYQLKQGDITNFRGMAQEIVEFRRMYNEEPLWTNAMFGGMPAYQISTEYPNDVIGFVDEVISLGLPRPANYLFLYLLGFYILMISMRVKPALAGVAAVAFAFSSYYFVILEAGHNSKAHAIAYMAPTLAGIIWAYRGRILFGGGVTALFLALQIGANHVQITYYFGFLVLFYAIARLYKSIREEAIPSFLKSSGVLIIAALVGILSNANNLYNTYQYGKYSTRGKTDLTITPGGESNADIVTEGLDKEYVTQWSYGIDETLTFLIPNAKGGESGALIDQNTQREDPMLYNQMAQGYQATQVFPNTYWGDQPFTSGPVYAGATVILLFLLGLFFLKKPIKWALLATVLLTVALSWGKNFMGLTEFFLDYIPGYDKFRAVTIILSITELVLPILGFLFVREVIRKPEIISENKKLYLGISGGLTLILLLFALVPDVFFNFLSDQENRIFSMAVEGEQGQSVMQYVSALQEARSEIFVADTFRSLAFVVLTALLIWLFAQGKIKERILILSLAVLVIADLWPINKRYVNNEKDRGRLVMWEPKENLGVAHTASAADMYILEREMEMNPRVEEAVEEAVSTYRAEVKSDPSRRATEDELNDVRFAALRFSTNYRVLNLSGTFQEARTSYFHQSVGGYHGAKLKRIQEIYDFHIQPEIQALTSALQKDPTINSIDRAMQEMDVVNMLNTKYIIYNPEAPPFENEYAYGPAWFVEYVEVAETADQEILALNELDLRREAVVENAYQGLVKDFSFSQAPTAAIAVEEHLPNYIRYIYDSPVPQAVIFSEIYYPEGWNAYLNGERVEYFRANYLLRGMVVPEGEHVIEFKFEPASFQTAAAISTTSGILAIIVFALALVKDFRTKPRDAYEEMMNS